jgi:flagellar protein FliJ
VLATRLPLALWKICLASRRQAHLRVKKFSFHLEAVLRHRKLEEDTEEQKLVKIHLAIQQAQQFKEALKAVVADHRQMLGQQATGKIDLDQVRHLILYLEKADQDIIQVSHVLSRLEEDKIVQLEKLKEAKKRTDVIEKLKGKSLNRHEREAMAMEQKLLDELSVTQYGQNAKQNLPTRKSNS